MNFVRKYKYQIMIGVVTFIVAHFLALLVISSFGSGSQERDEYESVYKQKTKSYGFPLLNKDTHRALTIDTSNDVVKFRVKKNVEDGSYQIDKTCTYVKKFTYYGLNGTFSSSASVTGATSSATGTLEYIDTKGNTMYLSGITGTFQDGETVYETANTIYVTLSDDGVWMGVTTLSATDTNLDAGDYFAYVELSNASLSYDEVLLKSKWKVVQ